MAERYCPRCLSALRKARGELMAVDMCVECGGAFFDHGELSKLARKHAEQFATLEALVEPKRVEATAAAAQSTLGCPGCGSTMETYEYAYCSGIKLDRCPRCSGTWVDEGELEAIGRHLDGGDKLAQADADRLAPYLAALAGEDASEQQVRSISAVAGMLNRPVRPSRV